MPKKKHAKQKPSNTLAKNPEIDVPAGSILVPLDFSPSSEHALEYAVRLAECLNTSITVLHVVHDPGDAPGYYNVKGQREYLNTLEERATELLGDFMADMVKRDSENTKLSQAQRLLVTGLPGYRFPEFSKLPKKLNRRCWLWAVLVAPVCPCYCLVRRLSS